MVITFTSTRQTMAHYGSQPKLGSNNQLEQPYVFLFSTFTVSRLVNPLEEEEEVPLEEDDIMPRRISSKYRTSEVDVADRCCSSVKTKVK